MDGLLERSRRSRTMSGVQRALPVRRSLVPVGLAAMVAGLLLAGAALVVAPYDVQLFIVQFGLVVVAAVWFIPRAVRREPTVTVTMLTAAFIVKLVGTGARFALMQLVFGGGDAVAFHLTGEENYHLVRSFDFSFVEPPYFGTDFMEDLPAFLYAVTGPTMLGGFLIFSMASFVGTWFLYRAHRIAFPDGDHRLYFWLLFFLPTMIFWPSSLGKDAVVIFGLGWGTYWLARLIQRVSPVAIASILLGGGLVFGVRPGVGAMFMVGSLVAFLIHPGRLASPFSRPIGMILLFPVVVFGLIFALQSAFKYENIDPSVEGVVTQYEATRETLFEEGGSAFEAPLPTSPSGVIQSIGTVLFRPFPWELGSALAIVAGGEAVLLFALVIARLPRAWRALKRWRGGIVVFSVIMTIALLAPLTAVTNFGLLVRQRAQMLPFLFLIFTAVRRPSRVAVRRPAPSPGLARPQVETA
jgi:hypothetical protein